MSPRPALQAPGISGDPREGPSTGPASTELGMQREALAFVAGFVASKCRHIDSSLGLPTSVASPADMTSVPSGWIQTISRGQLYVPSAWWMAAVLEFETSFSLVMGPTADQQPGILKRLVQLILQKQPRVDQRVARKLASTRLHLRLRQLNVARAEVQAGRSAARQVRQHSRSSK